MNRELAEAKLKKILDAREKDKKDRVSSGGANERHFDWLSIGDLPMNQKFKFRMLPPHPTKNPDGCAIIPRSSVYLERPSVASPYPNKPGRPPAGGQAFFLNGEGYREEDEYHGYAEDLLGKLNTYWETNGYPKEDDFEDPKDHNYFLVSLEAFKNPQWTTHEYPIVLYADFDVTSVTKGDKTYSNFTNYRPHDKKYVSRLFQITQTSVIEQLLDLEIQHQKDEAEDFPVDCHLGSATAGKDLTLIRKTKAEIIVGLSGNTGKLKPEILDMYGPESEHYPDLEEKRRGFMKNEQEMRDLVVSSWWGQYIQNKYGINL